MQEVQPEVRIVATTEADSFEIECYLDEVDPSGKAADSFTDHNPSPEELVMFAGKLCYRSFAPGLNQNVTKVRTDRKQYIEEAILKSGHGSVLEHASASFLFSNVSRVFTHELVRHRVGSSFSQESLRYVRLDELKFWMPEAFTKYDNAAGDGARLVRDTVKHLEDVQRKLAEIYGIDKEGLDFKTKKILTSAFRRVAPEGLGTAILWTANFRTLRHVIALRTQEAAEEEIRRVFHEVAMKCKVRWPEVFCDMYPVGSVNGDELDVSQPMEWRFDNPQQPYEWPKG